MPVTKIYHVDDDPRSIEKARKLICAREDLLQVGSSTNPEKALKEIKRFKPEILLLDLDMHPITGWDIMERIDQQKTLVVIITVDKEAGMASLAKGASFFLDKTYGKREFNVAIDKLTADGRSESAVSMPYEQGYEWFTSGGKSHPVRFYVEDIEAIVADGNDSVIYHTHGKTIVDQNLAAVEKTLPANRFMRVSRSHMIALDRFHQRLADAEIQLVRVENEAVKRVKVGDAYAKRFYKYLEEQFPIK